ncbi:flagellar protein [Rhodobacteraceae bacterium WD3A24]|nr:flagellar protein [Rhodobacteraceae bacterium WD3A24]
MSFQPVIPLGGLGGWRFLQRTQENQQETFAASARLQRDVAHFRDRIGDIGTAADLVEDRRLLRVALGAFGLQDDINNTFFIRRVLEDGTLDRTALANRLTDRRYRAFSEAFGFGNAPLPPATIGPGFADRIIEAYETRQFEVAIGRQDSNMRLALGAQRELAELAENGGTEKARWLTVMGTPPLRSVFETAFGLPESFGALDLDRQLAGFRDRSQRAFGEDSIAQFADPEKRDALIRRFLARAELQTGGGAPALPQSPALQILQSGARPGGDLGLL